MKKICYSILLLAFVLVLPFNEVQATTILLDGNTPATGSNLGIGPLITPYGNITFSGGEVYNGGGGFLHDGAYMSSSYAEFNFDFDVDSISFLAGSMAGGIITEALDINGDVIDSYFTLDTIMWHPVTLTGVGIRGFTFADGRLVSMGGGGWADASDIVLTVSPLTTPEPSTMLLLGSGLFGIVVFRKKLKK